MNIFEEASRVKLRFPTTKGMLAVEQLWDLPLTSLDRVARTANASLKEVTEESFIDVKPDPMRATYELQLDVVKHIIAVRIEERDKAQAAAERAAKRSKLLEALAAKEDEELGKKSREEILKELEELG